MGLIRKTHFIPYQLPEGTVQFSGNARSNSSGRNSPGLGVPDQFSGALLSSVLFQLQTDFWQLRGFTGAGFTANDDSLMLLNCTRNFCTARDNRQFFRVGDADS